VAQTQLRSSGCLELIVRPRRRPRPRELREIKLWRRRLHMNLMETGELWGCPVIFWGFGAEPDSPTIIIGIIGGCKIESGVYGLVGLGSRSRVVVCSEPDSALESLSVYVWLIGRWCIQCLQFNMQKPLDSTCVHHGWCFDRLRNHF
jgi:hypothetical protein